jgi:hypothetical protein
MFNPNKIKPGQISRTQAVKPLPVFAPRVIPADPICNTAQCKNPAEFMMAGSKGFHFVCTGCAFNESEAMRLSGKNPHDYLLKLHTLEEFEELRKKNEVRVPSITPADE